jgi:hypothetical protein
MASNNTVYSNKVIEAKATNLLTTAVNAKNFMTVDNSLASTSGMTKTINVYTYTGTAEELAKGAKNTNRGAISFKGTDYTVKRVQQVFDYNDEDYAKDNTVVDNLLKGANQVMANKMTEDFYTECAKATTKHEIAGAFSYDGAVDAIAKLNIENEANLFFVLPTAWKADIRKDEDYKAARMGEVVYGGQTGTIAGIPVITTNALTDKGYIMTPEAVKLFMKEDVVVEQDRDIESKENTVVLTTYYICALEDATKICEITVG